MGSKEPAQCGDMRDLEQALINPSWDVFQHHVSTLHKMIVVHIEADKAMDITQTKRFINAELVKKHCDLMDRSAQGQGIVQ